MYMPSVVALLYVWRQKIRKNCNEKANFAERRGNETEYEKQKCKIAHF